MNETFKKYILWILLIGIIIFAISSFTPQQLDYACSENNKTLTRINGEWICGNTTSITTNISNTYLNITNVTGGNITGTGVSGYIPYWTNSTNLNQSLIYYNSSSKSLIFGTNGKATNLNAVVFGGNGQGNFESCFVAGGINSSGSTSMCNATGGISIGSNAYVTGTYGIALGLSAKSIGLASVAIGSGANASGSTSIALGGGKTSTSANNGIAIGSGANSINSGTMMIGRGSTIYGLGNNCIGIAGSCRGITSLSIMGLDVTQTASIVIGQVNNTQVNSVMIGGTYGSSTEYFFLGQGKNVSLGTNNTPVQTVYQDAGTATATYHKFTAGTTTGTTATDGLSIGITSTANAEIRQYEDRNLTMWTNNVERLRLINTGLLGLNTTTPLQMLHVNGSILATNYIANNGSVGYTGTCASTTNLTVRNGLIVGCA